MADEDEGYVRAVAQKLKEGLEIKDRRWRLRTYKQTFLGTDAVEFFIHNNYAGRGCLPTVTLMSAVAAIHTTVTQPY